MASYRKQKMSPANNPAPEHLDRQALHDAIAAFAAELGGTELDLDRELESAGIESLLSMDGL
jgi:hypothetical protein